MSTPLCAHCVERPVKRAYGRVTFTEWGPRVVDGVSWRWFCSRGCSGQYRGQSCRGRAAIAQAAQTNQRKAEQRMVARLVAACQPLMDEAGKVEARAMVKVLAQEVRRERLNQATRRYKRRKAEAA